MVPLIQNWKINSLYNDYHPSNPFEKESCKVNHELLKRILPQGTSFDDLTQNDINLVMSPMNSYKRKKLNSELPYSVNSMV